MLQPFLSSQNLRKRTEMRSTRAYSQENKCFCMCITNTYSIKCSAERVLPQIMCAYIDQLLHFHLLDDKTGEKLSDAQEPNPQRTEEMGDINQ